MTLRQFFSKKHTWLHLKFLFNHQKSVKEGMAQSLLDRDETLCSNNDEIRIEIKYVNNDLLENDYPQQTIKNLKEVG